MSKKKNTFTLFHAIILSVSGIVAFTIFMIYWPTIQETYEMWQLQQERQQRINACSMDEDQEHARAVFCD